MSFRLAVVVRAVATHDQTAFFADESTGVVFLRETALSADLCLPHAVFVAAHGLSLRLRMLAIFALAHVQILLLRTQKLAHILSIKYY